MTIIESQCRKQLSESIKDYNGQLSLLIEKLSNTFITEENFDPEELIYAWEKIVRENLTIINSSLKECCILSVALDQSSNPNYEEYKNYSYTGIPQ